jgi:hypothetical protein
VRVHSLTLSFTPRLPSLARNLASPCLGREPKVKVVTKGVHYLGIQDGFQLPVKDNFDKIMTSLKVK